MKTDEEIAEAATKRCWLLVNKRIISFHSFQHAVTPEILAALRESKSAARQTTRFDVAGCPCSLCRDNNCTDPTHVWYRSLLPDSAFGIESAARQDTERLATYDGIPVSEVITGLADLRVHFRKKGMPLSEKVIDCAIELLSARCGLDEGEKHTENCKCHVCDPWSQSPTKTLDLTEPHKAEDAPKQKSSLDGALQAMQEAYEELSPEERLMPVTPIKTMKQLRVVGLAYAVQLLAVADHFDPPSVQERSESDSAGGVSSENPAMFQYICPVCQEPIFDNQGSEHTEQGLTHFGCTTNFGSSAATEEEQK